MSLQACAVIYMTIHIIGQLNIVSILIFQKYQRSSRNEQLAAVFLPSINTSMKSLSKVACCVRLA